MTESLWQQGVELMLYGMGTVFLFLALLILTTAAMSALVQRFLPQQEPLHPVRVRAGPVAATDDKQLVAVIGAAIHRHRQNNNE